MSQIPKPVKPEPTELEVTIFLIFVLCCGAVCGVVCWELLWLLLNR